jgi:FkbM family methyltransferase
MLRHNVGYTGRIVSYEPGPAFPRLAEAAAGDTGWTVEHVAVGDHVDEVVLNVTASDVFSSIYQPSREAKQAFATETVVVDQQRVPLIRLDQADLPAARSIMVKSDTQGFDLQVIDGCTGILDRVQVVVLEAPMLPLYEGAPDAPTILARLNDCGFVLLRSFPTNEWQGLGAVDQDWVFVRRPG